MSDSIRDAVTAAFDSITEAHGTTDRKRAERDRLAFDRHPANPANRRRTRIIDAEPAAEPVIPDGWTVEAEHDSWLTLVNPATGERLAFIDRHILRGPFPHPRFMHPDWC